MKLAKKTLSVALAAVMAASSLAGATSAFAADDSVAKSAVKYTAITGSATVKPNVTIDNTKARKTSSQVNEENKESVMLSHVDPTSLSSYYSFTPSKTGYYEMKVATTAVYYGYSEALYNKYAAQYTTVSEDKYHVYATKPDGLFSDKAFKNALTEADTVDKDSYTIKISNIDATDNDSTSRNKFISETKKDNGKDNGTVTAQLTQKDAHVLSYKYTKFNGVDYIVADKTEDNTAKPDEVEIYDSDYSDTEQYLLAGKTYYFKATFRQDLLITTDEATNASNAKDPYIDTVSTGAPVSATITISMRQGMVCSVNYKLTTDEKDYQVLEAPKGTSITIGGTVYTSNYDAKLGKYVVKLPVEKKTASASYYGSATSATVPDTYSGANVTTFDNKFAGITSLTLGKNVEKVTGLGETTTPQLTKVVITNPNYNVTKVGLGADVTKVTLTVPSNSIAYNTALAAGYKVNVACTHKWVVTKAATIFATGSKKCSECDAVATIAKVKFAPTAKASKKKIVVKGNAGKVKKLAVWVYDSKGNLVKKQVKKNVTKNTVKVSKAGKYTVKVKAYGTNGAKTSSVKKTVKVK